MNPGAPSQRVSFHDPETRRSCAVCPAACRMLPSLRTSVPNMAAVSTVPRWKISGDSRRSRFAEHKYLREEDVIFLYLECFISVCLHVVQGWILNTAL